ncbi:MAG: HlyC/CorC family transporter [Myxococcales bacterium]|nr:HlyC/CorC family transporter [Myxococcales bacterium]
MMTLSTLITIGVVAVIVHALLVATEIALASCDRARLHQRATAGGLAARAAERLSARTATTAATVQVGANLASLALAVACAIYLLDHGRGWYWAAALAAPPILIVGQLIPRAIATAHGDRLAPALALLTVPLGYLLRPLVVIVVAVVAAATRLIGTDKKKAFITRDELALLIESDPVSDKPGISAAEREMIANVFELSEYAVGDLMVPLSEVTALPEDSSLGEAALEVADKQHSRMPIYRSRVDDIVGIVHAFDILSAGPDRKAIAISDVARAVIYVPESMKAIDLLVQLQAGGNPMAVVVDEYGGAIGIVTVEDLLETIVGEIDDEYDDEPSPLKAEKPGVWRVEAKISVAKLNQQLDLGLPESDDYETIAGLLIERFRKIPAPGATLTVGGVLIEVVGASERAVESVRLTRRKR